MASTGTGGRINIAVWLTQLCSMLVVTAKLLSNKSSHPGGIANVRNYHLDDALLLLCLVASLAQTITVSQQVNAGLGQDSQQLSDSSITQYEKLGYSSQILYILTILLSKTTGYLFALHLRPGQTLQMAFKAVIGFLALWGITSFIAIAVQCSAPDTWKLIHGRCFDQFGFWAYFESINIVIDVLLVSGLLGIVWSLQLPPTKKVVLYVAFSSRLLGIPSEALRIVYLHRFYQPSPHSEWNFSSLDGSVAVVTSVVMGASIISTCIPFLKPLLDAMQPGWSNSSIIQGIGFSLHGSSAASAAKLQSFRKGTVLSDTHIRVRIGSESRNGSFSVV